MSVESLNLTPALSVSSEREQESSFSYGVVYLLSLRCSPYHLHSHRADRIMSKIVHLCCLLPVLLPLPRGGAAIPLHPLKGIEFPAAFNKFKMEYFLSIS